MKLLHKLSNLTGERQPTHNDNIRKIHIGEHCQIVDVKENFQDPLTAKEALRKLVADGEITEAYLDGEVGRILESDDE